MEQTVRHGEIGKRVDIDLLIRNPHSYVAAESEVVSIVSVESSIDCVIVVQNRSHSIKPETIDVVGLNKVEELPEKELHDLPFPIVEALRSPQGVVSCLSSCKILVIRPVEEIETVSSVGRRVTTRQTDIASPPLNDVHDHEQSGFVDRVYESLGWILSSSVTMKSVGVPYREEGA